ncbi:helix-turn-helix domain-containing protein [Actinomyces faecalis]|uniref:helix-turn-helix domain-containing protein n=1 Tax=Actinomyces faecalis TaxID=2722820 RepID=UPI00155675F6
MEHEPREFWTAREMAAQLSISEKELAALRTRGDGPPFIYLGRRVRYPVAAVRRWTMARSRCQTGAGR